MNNNILMRIHILLFLLISHSATHAATILSQGARNVKNGAAYGGASAFGDGVHDDTQAILDAININRDINTPVAVYIPPGTYMVHSTIIVWNTTFLFGEPSSPPTIVLQSGSMTSGSAPFIVPRSSYNHNPYDTNWSALGGSYASANNTFLMDIRDINFTVQSNNAGCFTVMLYEMAQQCSFRNSVLTSTSQQSDTFELGQAGGNAIVNVTMTGNNNACVCNSFAGEQFFRGCTFSGTVNVSGVNACTFVACTFTSGLTWSGQVLGLYDCGTVTPLNVNSGDYHLENTNGQVQQTSSGHGGVYFNRVSESSTSANCSQKGVARGSLYPNPALVYPTSACVNVKSAPYNAKGDGSTNDTTAINSALSASNEVFFPTGIYNVGGSTITVTAGKKLFGCGSGCSTIYGTGSPIISLTGAGSGNGVVLENLWIQRNTSSGVGGHLMDMNCDPSSLLLDVFVDNNNDTATMTSDVNIQSGGGFIENAWWAGSPVSVGGIVITTTTGPVTIYDIQPEHWFGASIVCNGANNVTIMNIETEGGGGSTGPAIITVTNSNNINLHQMFFAASNLPIGLKVTGSQVNSWSMNMDTNSQGLVNENGTAYGTTFLDGYINFKASPIQLQSQR